MQDEIVTREIHAQSMKNAAAIDQEGLARDKVTVRGREIDENAEQIFRRLESLNRARF
jgi:hypothetical protein